MVVETSVAAVAAIAAESMAEAAVVEAAEATAVESVAESSISGATELSETLSAIEKEVPREIVNERVDAALREPTFRNEILRETYADFSEHCKFETRIPEGQFSESDYHHFKHCNEQLSEACENGSLDKEQFTHRQLEQIENGDKPEGYTWHHHEDKGRMQLVDSEIHAKTPHTGGRSIWGGGSEARQ